MVFQSFALMPHMSVLQNAAYGLEIAGVAENERKERALKALEQVGLKANARSFPNELSGGMQQRVGLARGLAVDPSIMLMDEAFSALDPLIRTEMQDELIKLQAESQRTIIFISHDLDEAMRIGDRIAIMEGGRIVQVGSPEEILKNPADEYVRAFFRGVDPTNVLRAGDIVRDTQVRIVRHRGEGPRSALELLMENDREYGYVLDQQKRFLGVVSIDSLKTAINAATDGEKALTEAFLSDVETVPNDSSLQDILPIITKCAWAVPVVDENNVYQGAISKNVFLRTLERDTH
jgi:glycine betaine/proline transport system ATP-binding protein